MGGEQGLQLGEEWLQHAQRSCRAAVEEQRWEEALAQLEQLRILIPELTPELTAKWWVQYGTLLNLLVHRIHPLITSLSTDPPPPLRRAELCWRMHRVLLLHHSLPVEAPGWMAVLEGQFVKDGALYWRELIGLEEGASGRALELFERLAELLRPCPQWVRLAVESLRELPRPEAESGSGLRLALVIRPGAEPVLQGPDRLDCNLAPHLEQLESGEAEPLERLLDRYLREVSAANHTGELEAEGANTSLISGVNVLWRSGEELSLQQFERLGQAAAAWTQSMGPSGLDAKPASSIPPPLQLSHLPLALELDTGELAVLQRVVMAPDSLNAALDRLEKQAAGKGGRSGPQRTAGLGAIDTEEALRRFQLEAGFYASRSEPIKSLECWSQGALACLTSVALWGEGAVWSQDRTSPWLYLPLAQAIASGSGRLQWVHRPPPLEALHGRMAGEEVLYLGPLAEAVEEQHRSGNCLRLYHDLEIGAYGLRCLAPPESRPPRRPHEGFQQSLEHCLEGVERLQGESPFSLALVGPGAYRLPLCTELRRRFGMSCLGLGAQLHQLFGLELPGEPLREEGRRRAEHWRRLSHEP